MNDESIEKFLQGTADDKQQQQCELLLSDPETVVDCKSTVSDDSLLTALRVSELNQSVDPESARLLADRIEQLVPRHAMGVEELKQLLDPPTHSDDLGVIGKYRVIEFLASGGSGLVFRCIDSQLERSVCIKLLKPASQFNPEAKARFERESRDAARLVNDRIVAVIDAGTQKGLPWFAMPMLEGVSLRTLIQRTGAMEPDVVLRYAREIAEGLSYAHGRSLMHRDIKPDNLWVTEKDEIKILDFGLARVADESTPITRSGTVIGTPSYMSPEQVTGKDCDQRSDLFSLGVVMVELLTGQSPFKRPNLFSTLMSIAGDQIDIDKVDPEGTIPAGIRQLVQDLLQIDPNKRIGSADKLIERLDQVQLQPHIVSAADRKHGRGWLKALAGAIFGISACLAAFGILTATDKGTLVVETDDANVEIKIGKERVTVHDPVTDRSYEIRIGDTPLPSGVYHLETTDASGDLVFSSETITIRRGKKAIVRVELRKPGIAKADANKDFGANPRLEVWVDKSYDPEARDKFATTLTSLPAITLVEDNESGARPPIGQRALVQKPARLEGIESWSIELGKLDANKVGYKTANCNGTLFASVDDLVRIHDGAGVLKFMLPVKGIPGEVYFDHKFPNLLATVSFVADPTLPIAEFPANRYEISIWRLQDDYAELLHRVPASKPYVAWDLGYRIAFVQGTKLAMFRLDDASTFIIEDSVPEVFSEKAISPDGRYLVTRSHAGNQYQINLWDLKQCKFVATIPDSYQSQWKNDSTQIAVRRRRLNTHDIWSVENPTLLKSVVLPTPEPNRANPTNTIVSRAMESNFGRMAWVTENGELTIRNLENNRQASLNIDSTEKPDRNVRLEWKPDGSLKVISSLAEFRWTPTLSDVHGELSAIERTSRTSDENQKNTELALVSSSHREFANVAWSSSSVTKQNRTESFMNVARLNLGQLAIEKSRPLKLRQTNWKLSSTSPNGKFIVYSDTENTRSRGPKSIKFAELGESVKPFELGSFQSSSPQAQSNVVRSVRWSENSDFLVITGLPSSRGLMVFDTRSRKLIDGSDLGLPSSYVRSIWVWQNRFLVVMETEGKQSYVETWLVNPYRGSAKKTYMFKDFETVSVVWRYDDYVIFQGYKKGEAPDRKSLVRLPVHYYKSRIVDDRLVDLQRYTTKEFDYVHFSSQGNYLFRLTYDVDRVKVSGALRSPDSRKERKKTLILSTWKAAVDNDTDQLHRVSMTRFLSPTWHRNQNVVAWKSREGFSIFNAATQSVITLPYFDPASFTSADFGWLVAHQNRLMALNPQGELLGHVVFDPFVNEDGGPTNARWILADGSIDRQTKKDGLFIVYCKGNRAYCNSLSDFASNSDNPKLPFFDTLPFIAAE